MDFITSIQKAIDYIEDNIFDNLEYHLIAKQACMSSYHFQRVFSLVCNCTLGEYIRNRRLTLAGSELLTTDHKIIDIALKHGYDSHESFSRAFTRFYGMAPSVARNRKSLPDSFAKITIKSILEGRKDAMQDLSKRGYLVKENGSVYYTEDMDRTAKWFRDVLGWYDEIDARNEDGKGTYGCVCTIPHDLAALHIVPFTGIHMFYGKPQKCMVAFILVQGLDKLYEFVTKQGWEQITEIKMEPWGCRTCDVTTVDGCIIRFFE